MEKEFISYLFGGLMKGIRIICCFTLITASIAQASNEATYPSNVPAPGQASLPVYPPNVPAPGQQQQRTWAQYFASLSKQPQTSRAREYTQAYKEPTKSLFQRLWEGSALQQQWNKWRGTPTARELTYDAYYKQKPQEGFVYNSYERYKEQKKHASALGDIYLNEAKKDFDNAYQALKRTGVDPNELTYEQRLDAIRALEASNDERFELGHASQKRNQIEAVQAWKNLKSKENESAKEIHDPMSRLFYNYLVKERNLEDLKQSENYTPFANPFDFPQVYKFSTPYEYISRYRPRNIEGLKTDY